MKNNNYQEIINELKKLLAPALEERGNKPLFKLDYDLKSGWATLEYLSYGTYMPSEEPENYRYKLLVHYDFKIEKNIDKIINRTIIIMADKLVSKEQDNNMMFKELMELKN